MVKRADGLSCSEHLQDVELINKFEVHWTDGKITEVDSHREYLDGSHGGQGQLLVRRGDLLAIDGYNSHLGNWGLEDVDVLIRLQRFLGLRHKSCGEALHLSHGDEARDLGGIEKWESNRRNAAVACKNYHRGILRGTLAEDTAEWAAHIRTSRNDPVQSRYSYEVPSPK